MGAGCIVFTTGPFAPLTWEEAADALDAALAPVLVEARANHVDFAIEHTNSLRVDVGFVHTLRDAIDLARRLDTGVCMEVNACWAERALAATIRAGVDRIRLVQVSDFKVGTVASSQRLVPGDGDIPIGRILGELVTAGYSGSFELELIGDAILTEGYDVAVPRAVALDELLESRASSSEIDDREIVAAREARDCRRGRSVNSTCHRRAPSRRASRSRSACRRGAESSSDSTRAASAEPYENTLASRTQTRGDARIAVPTRDLAETMARPMRASFSLRPARGSPRSRTRTRDADTARSGTRRRCSRGSVRRAPCPRRSPRARESAGARCGR